MAAAGDLRSRRNRSGDHDFRYNQIRAIRTGGGSALPRKTVRRRTPEGLSHDAAEGRLSSIRTPMNGRKRADQEAEKLAGVTAKKRKREAEIRTNLLNRTRNHNREICRRGLRRCPPSVKPPATSRAPPKTIRTPTARRGAPDAADKEVETATPAPRREKMVVLTRSVSTFTAPTLPRARGSRVVAKSRGGGLRGRDSNGRDPKQVPGD